MGTPTPLPGPSAPSAGIAGARTAAPAEGPVASAEDLASVVAMRAGDEQGLAALYDRHAPGLLGLIARIVAEPADAEAVLMETFLQAWRGADRFDPTRGSPLAWLVTIARTRALDHVRRDRRRAAREPLGDEDAALRLIDASTDPLDDAVASERRAAVEAAVASLPAEQRAPIALAFFDGLTHVEVAERLGVPLGTVKTRIRLGLTKLRDRLVPRAGDARP